MDLYRPDFFDSKDLIFSDSREPLIIFWSQGPDFQFYGPESGPLTLKNLTLCNI